MTFPAVIRGRINPSFHGRIIGQSPIAIDKAGLTYTASFDASEITETTSVPDLSAYKAIVRDGNSDSLLVIPLSDLPTGATSWDDIQGKPALVQEARLISTTAPLSGGGDLSADRTLSISANGITYSLIQQVAASKLVGNPTGSTANASEIGLTSGHLAFSGSNVGLASTAVTPGSYTNANITVDAQGRLTAAASGTPGGVQMTRMSLLTLSGTEQGWTTIPANTFKIDIVFGAFLLSGTDLAMIQLGDSGGYETTGYNGGVSHVVNAAATAAVTNSSGFNLFASGTGSPQVTGMASLLLSDPSSNVWVFSYTGARISTATTYAGSGGKALSATLDRVRIITSGSNTFSGGSLSAICWHT